MAFEIDKVIRTEVNKKNQTISYVQWKGYSPNYNCWTLIDDGISPEIEDDEVPQDELNFVSMDTILAGIRSRTSCPTYNYQPIIIENYYYQFLERAKDYLLILSYQSHAHVLLIYN